MHYRLPPELKREFSDPVNFGGHLFPGPPDIAIPLAVKWVLEINKQPPESSDNLKIICVGDVVSRFFFVEGKPYIPLLKYCFIDGTTQRGQQFTAESHVPATWKIIEKANPAGVIEEDLFAFIRATRENDARYVIQIDGEEDLLVIPSVLECPHRFVFYGQPPVTDAGKSIPAGCVVVHSSNTIRQTFSDILSRFEQIR